MYLFEHDSNINCLPRDGVVNYFGKIFNQTSAVHYFNSLVSTVDWRQDEAIIHGKHIITQRQYAWYADQAYQYTYSKITRTALPWTQELLQLKKIVEEATAENFNSCLLNLYHSGAQSMAWHSDKEKDLKKNGAIASLSLGAERKFSFKHKETQETVSIFLEHGSLLVMKGTTQSHWLHALPKSQKVKDARINLTFRSTKTAES